jgi:staphyloferrin B biosynthesis citrate synthase
MSGTRPSARDFRKRLTGGGHVLGTFIKTPTSHSIEIIGGVGFDFTIIDQEHAPFDRSSIDIGCLAARAANTAAIVRVAEPSAASILSVLDCGATGVMVPHVDSPEKAREMAQACRYRNGVRGFSNTTRAGSFGGATFDEHIAQQDAEVTFIAMIEDAGALPHLEAIAATPGLDAFFIGRGDLTAALGVEKMREAVQVITAAGRKTGKTMIALVSSRDDARAMRELGITGFVFSNDQNLMKAAAAQALKDYGDPKAW